VSESRLFQVSDEERSRQWGLLERLYPIARSLMGEGYRRSIDLLRERLPLEVLEIPTGTKLGSWAVPPEWRVRDAWVEDESGRRLFGYRESPFHLWHYSAPFEGVLSRDELLGHVATSDLCPDGIPLVVTYYRRTWGFSVTAKQQSELTGDRYRVVVDTEFVDGSLTIGWLDLPGDGPKTILLDAVLSSPSLANNMSGVVVAVTLAELLMRQERRRLGYRLFLTPETIGPIALFHFAPDLLADVVAGCTFVNLGDSGDFHYRQSRPGDTVVDRAVRHVLRQLGSGTAEPFDVRTGTCGNEKAYNSLGIEIPVGSLRRSHLGAYPEYDTSRDDMSQVEAGALFQSLQVAWAAVQTIERDVILRHRFDGEPFLTGYGLFPKIANVQDRLAWDYLMGFSTGDLTTVEIADRGGFAVDALDQPVRLMLEKGLLEEVERLPGC